MEKLTLLQPDDWHLHLRDDAYLTMTVADATKQFARAIVMPNLKPPITDVISAIAYRERILKVVPEGKSFQPLMTLYLTEQMQPATILEAKNSGIIYGCKLYPAGATTHSQSGVTKIENIFPILESMEELDIPLLIHGEVTDENIDVFDREKYFIDTKLIPLVNRFKKLRMVLEHITTSDAVEYIKTAPDTIVATMTVHHLLMNRNHILVDGIHPHHYCLPVLKRNTHQLALIGAATSGNKKFFLGTDSAPHARELKENARGCAGIYTAHAAIELYAEVFEMAGALDKLEGFASCYGADFYGLPRNIQTITLIKESWQVPEKFSYGDSELIPFRAGENVSWRCVK